MKIGILTFHASHNYGSMLQNYALQQFLIAEGYSVETINLRNEKQKYMYNHPLKRGKGCSTWRSYLKRFVNPLWMIREIIKWHRFEYFVNNYLLLSKREYKNWKEIYNDIPQLNYDVIIVGGDQIWNTFCYDFDWSYFLPDDIRPTRKLSFSPSMGNEVEKTRKDVVKINNIIKYLHGFESISVREEDSSRLLSSLLKRDISVVIDPTLLLDSDAYEKLIEKPLIKKPYIYYYTPSHIPDVEAEQIALEISHKKGLDIITSYPHLIRNKGMKSYQMSGPMEFLNLIKNSELVLGRSYHLIIFSIIFHKEFITIKNSKDSRLKTLLNRLGISYRNINSIKECDNVFERILYNNIDKELISLRNEGCQYLKDKLNNNIN